MQVKESGWFPYHIIVRESGSDRLVGCCPNYLKASHLFAKLPYLCSFVVNCGSTAGEMHVTPFADHPPFMQSHSYGEYVFDHSWASFASRLGQSYCEPSTAPHMWLMILHMH